MTRTAIETHGEGWSEAIASHDWERAHQLLSSADQEEGLDAEGLEQLGEVARWTRRYDEMIEALERALDARERGRERGEGARVAAKLAIEYFQRDELALAGASLARAEEIVGESGDTRAAGMVLYCRASVALETGETRAAIEITTEMAEMAQRLTDRDLEALALMLKGRALQLAGDFEQGSKLLDRAAARAIGGGLDLWTSGVVLCANISASRHRCDIRSASEWSDAALRWCRRNSLGYFPGLCRLHMAETLNQRGDFEGAIAEAEPAINDLMAAMPRLAGSGIQELGEIKRRQGDLDAAEAIFGRCVEMGGDGLPGRILLKLDRGDPDAALALARDRLAEHGDRRLGASAAQILPPACRAAVEAGDLEQAQSYLEELGRVADACETPALRGAFEVETGRLLRSGGEPGAAVEHLRSGRRIWSDLDAPFECAAARAELARAELDLGDRSGAEVEIEAAAAMLGQIGAEHARRQVLGLLEAEEPVARRAHRTMLFTDIVGSTKLVEALGDEAWESMLAWHDRALRSCVAESGGTEVKHEGDGLFAAFSDPATAVSCACEIQRKLRRHQSEQGFAPSLRIGVHADEVNDRGGDYGGRGVHLAARVMGAAGAGEVLVTKQTLDLLTGKVPVREERELDAKGIAEPVVVASLEWRPQAGDASI